MNVVLDANILVSAFLAPHGEDARVLRQAQTQNLYLSPFILSEVHRTLHYPRIRKKYRYSDAAIQRHVKDLARISMLIHPQRTLANVCRDLDDNAVLACAVEANADYLVTRNVKHFPKTYEEVKIIHPRQFLAMIEK